MFKVKLIEVGNGVGIVLPKEVLARLKVREGDSVELTECAGGFIISRYDAEMKG
jgi:putative addiction module antidote